MTITRLAAPALLLLALAGCTAAPAPVDTPAPSEPAAESCADVTVVVEFGDLDGEPVEACAPAGTAFDALGAAGIDTEGTADFGDDVVCRVNDLPTPEEESCATFSDSAYWALWIKPAGGEWAFAQEGVTTQEVVAGDSLGLVYTPLDGEAAPPQG